MAGSAVYAKDVASFLGVEIVITRDVSWLCGKKPMKGAKNLMGNKNVRGAYFLHTDNTYIAL